jgi:hypothetical protein
MPEMYKELSGEGEFVFEQTEGGITGQRTFIRDDAGGDVAAASLEGGVITLNGAASGQGCQIRTDPAFVADTDSRLAWGCRYKMVDADQVNVVMGLAVAGNDYPGQIASTTADSIVVRHTGDATIFYQVNTAAGGMVAALRGLPFPTPFGPAVMRALDHQSTMGAYVGKLDVRAGRGVMVDWRYADGAGEVLQRATAQVGGEPFNERVAQLDIAAQIAGRQRSGWTDRKDRAQRQAWLLDAEVRAEAAAQQFERSQ